ncbi:hypothetical protein [Pseudocitrobacter corydidari]|uniref:Uncharacterized protein n=1 Tax=Pseudocitrobacter corydidari TaxID=2891570 RepID=A0ABY3S1K1_9ENTR|nr:hypothetical protein [Pseudocitrobacter corydidari]UGS40507.1 hypothetical protein G163CM_12050 [Pseudocitrobacter corydidari]UGS40517.1 hypothetical protein G163CM_12150 [Pseudocitrobacter corydidari]
MLKIETEIVKLIVGNSDFLIEIPKSLYNSISEKNKKSQLTSIKNNEAEKIECFLRGMLYFDEKPPSKRQMEYILTISEKLNIKLNKKIFSSTSAASDFIDKYKIPFDAKVKEDELKWIEYQKSDEYKILLKVEAIIKRHIIRYSTTKKKLLANQMIIESKTLAETASAIGVTESTINKYLAEIEKIDEQVSAGISSWLVFHHTIANMMFINKESLSPSEWRDTIIRLSMHNKWYEKDWFFIEE